VINNASGTLRPLSNASHRKDFTGRLQEFLTLIFYPAEVTAHLEKTLTDPAALRAYAKQRPPAVRTHPHARRPLQP